MHRCVYCNCRLVFLDKPEKAFLYKARFVSYHKERSRKPIEKVDMADVVPVWRGGN
jgi:hypothetical protein